MSLTKLFSYEKLPSAFKNGARQFFNLVIDNFNIIIFSKMIILTQEVIPLNDFEFQNKLDKIKEENSRIEMIHLLRMERKKFSRFKVETSKLLAVYLFVLLNAIVAYAMFVMWTFQDLSYLGVLITDIAAQVLVYAIYCLKAYNGKKQSELVKIERDKLSGTLGELLDTGSTDNGQTLESDSCEITV